MQSGKSEKKKRDEDDGESKSMYWTTHVCQVQK